MRETTAGPPAARPTASTRVFVGTFVALFALIGVLLFVDFFLARIERTETVRHAADLYAEGRAFLATGRIEDASDRLASAMSLDRGSVPYALAYAQAMIADKRSADAEAALGELLVRAPNDGAVNLTMARLLAGEHRFGEAKAYFHRAIYGSWGADSVAQRLATRFELADLLAARDARAELLAELLPLQSAPADSQSLLARAAPLYMAAGSPTRALEAYRQLRTRMPGAPTPEEGIGEAALALGEYRTARRAYDAALREAPDAARLQLRGRLVDTLLALDPNERGLSAAERLARARLLLGRTTDIVEACGRADAGTDPRALDDSARRALASHALPSALNAETESVLAAALSLWRKRPAGCAPRGVTEDATVRLIEFTARPVS